MKLCFLNVVKLQSKHCKHTGKNKQTCANVSLCCTTSNCSWPCLNWNSVLWLKSSAASCLHWYKNAIGWNTNTVKSCRYFFYFGQKYASVVTAHQACVWMFVLFVSSWLSGFEMVLPQVKVRWDANNQY